MTTVVCTAAERDLILAGARHLVVPGDREGCQDCTNLADHWFVAPQRWVDATGPCPTCDGSHEVEWFTDEDEKLNGVHPCPDCIDGRKRVALAVPCANFCGEIGESCQDCVDGSVVFAHATVEVLSAQKFYAGWTVIEAQSSGTPLERAPLVDRDWVVVLDDVGLAP
jgi:hypothetical protein